jgi:hypothetical protein
MLRAEVEGHGQDEREPRGGRGERKLASRVGAAREFVAEGLQVQHESAVERSPPSLTIFWGMYDAPVDRLRSVHNSSTAASSSITARTCRGAPSSSWASLQGRSERDRDRAATDSRRQDLAGGVDLRPRPAERARLRGRRPARDPAEVRRGRVPCRCRRPLHSEWLQARRMRGLWRRLSPTCPVGLRLRCA